MSKIAWRAPFNLVYYVFKNPRLFFVLGLMFSHSLVYYAVTGVLMWYFTYYDGDLVTSAILSNIHESSSSLLTIVMANASDSFLGRFRTLLFSTTAYIGGLMLLWMFNPYDVKWLIVVILVLLALGTSGGLLLEDVLMDLVHDNDNDKSEDESQKRATILSYVAYTSGAICAILWVVPSAILNVHQSWETSFVVCISTMIAALVIFCKGHNIYRQDKLIDRPIEIFFRVCHVWIQMLLKSNSRCSTNTSRQEGSLEKLDTQRRENEGITRETSLLCLDTEAQYKKDKAVVKSLFRMFPMWLTFFVVSLISATGSTFFAEQYNNLKGPSNIPFQIYNVIQNFSGFTILFLYQRAYACCFRKNVKVQIGVGMLCSIISCVFAWQLEVHRLKEVNDMADEDANTSISFLWLAPQFCMLGCMERFTDEGLLKFFKSQVDELRSSYGEDYVEFVKGLGKLLNIILILIFKSRLGWFSETINESRLDKYYILLVCVCSVNFIIYGCIATCCYKEAKQHHVSAEDD